MNRWHFPQRERGLPVAARGEKDTSISSSMPESKQCRSQSSWPSSPVLSRMGGLKRVAIQVGKVREYVSVPKGGGVSMSLVGMAWLQPHWQMRRGAHVWCHHTCSLI